MATAARDPVRGDDEDDGGYEGHQGDDGEDDGVVPRGGVILTQKSVFTSLFMSPRGAAAITAHEHPKPKM